MDQREAMTPIGSGSYYIAEPVSGFQNSPNNMSLLSNSAMSSHGVGVGPPAMPQARPVGRKRGRPRKYGHDGSVSLGVSTSESNAAQNVRPTQKGRRRPQGPGRKHQSASTGTGTMSPHIINIAAGEDIKIKILSLLQGNRALFVLSGIGSIAAANIKLSSSAESVTYEGYYDMVTLSGSYVYDVDNPHGPTGGLNVTFLGPDGRLKGGPVEGVLIAASHVQVIAGSIMMPSPPKPKPKAVEDQDTSGDQDPTFGDSITQANIQPSQSLSHTDIWHSSR